MDLFSFDAESALAIDMASLRADADVWARSETIASGPRVAPSHLVAGSTPFDWTHVDLSRDASGTADRDLFPDGEVMSDSPNAQLLQPLARNEKLLASAGGAPSAARDIGDAALQRSGGSPRSSE